MNARPHSLALLFALFAAATYLQASGPDLAGRWEGKGRGMFGMRYEVRLELAEDGTATLLYADEEPPHTLNSDFQRNLVRATGRWTFADDYVHLDIFVREWKRQFGSDESVDVEPNDAEPSLDSNSGDAKPPRGRGIRNREFFLQEDGTLLQAMMSFSGSETSINMSIFRHALAVELARIEQPKRADPVGEWTNGEEDPGSSLCFWESGDGLGEISTPGGDAIHLEGKWRVIPEGRWKDHVSWQGKVVYWAKSGNQVTPPDERFEFVLSVEPTKLSLIRGGDLKASDGTMFQIFGPRGNSIPVFRRQNDQRPSHRTPGNS